jgi:acetyl esterase/lipase
VAGEGVFVLLHGGGFVNGGGATHYGLASRLSKVTGMKVLLPDYRLAPEQPYPAAVIDAVAVYGAILASGVPAEKIVVGGDSAGGGLTLQMLLALREADAPLPLAAVLLSPWTDLTQSGASYDKNAARDPIIERDRLTEAARQYAGDLDLASPLLSVLNAELGGLPPMLIHAGGHEVMLDDSAMFAERARAAGVEVLLEVWPEMWHVWHQWAPDCPEANDAIDKIGAFVKAQVRADDGS